MYVIRIISENILYYLYRQQSYPKKKVILQQHKSFSFGRVLYNIVMIVLKGLYMYTVKNIGGLFYS